MAALFSSPKTPTVPAPVPPPAVDVARDNASQNDFLRRRQGRLSTLLSPDVSESGAPTSSKTLLGS